MDLRGRIKQVLADNKLATVSTVNPRNNAPESALIAFVENDELELFFQTSNKTKKYQNLLSNKDVALVIGFGWTNLQYEGRAMQVQGHEELKNIKQLFAKKDSPTTQYYLDLPDTVIFKIAPRWIGYRNYDKHPPEIDELKF